MIASMRYVLRGMSARKCGVAVATSPANKGHGLSSACLPHPRPARGPCQWGAMGDRNGAARRPPEPVRGARLEALAPLNEPMIRPVLRCRWLARVDGGGVLAIKPEDSGTLDSLASVAPATSRTGKPLPAASALSAEAMLRAEGSTGSGLISAREALGSRVRLPAPPGSTAWMMWSTAAV